MVEAAVNLLLLMHVLEIEGTPTLGPVAMSCAEAWFLPSPAPC